MVSKKTIKELDFKTIEEYFEYILDSKTNGQRPQAKELFNDLSKKQKLDFYEYVNRFINPTEFINLLDYLMD